MGRIRQFGVGVPELTLARLERLRACLGESRSHVVELALSGQGLDGLEAEHVSEIRRFGRLAASADQDWVEYALEYGRIYARQTYPPKVAELEKAWFAEEPLTPAGASGETAD